MTTFTYTLISDMHVNHPQKPTPYNKFEENVIVAGDTANGLEGLKFLHKIQKKGHTVYAVDGNHEHYLNVNQRRTIDETTAKFRELFPMITDIDDKLTLVNLNGWYAVDAPVMWDNYMNDCRCCFGSDEVAGAKAITSEAQFQAAVLDDLLENFFDRKFIVTTHTAPCVETLDPKYEGEYSNNWYWSPYMRQVLATHSDKILAWNHGHTHSRNHAVIDGVPVYVNPRGYPGENPDWEPQTISVEY